MSLIDRELIDAYLAGRLDPSTQEQVEARIVGDPVFRSEVELTDGLRGGLRELDARDELDTEFTVKRPSFWRRPASALAASVVAGLLGLTALALHGQLQRGRAEIARLEQVVEGLQPDAITGLRVRSVTRSRAAGGEPDLVLGKADRNEPLELRLDVGPEPASMYRVTLDSVAGLGGATPSSVPAVAHSADGAVVLVVNASLVPPGDYTLTLVPAGEAADSVRYRVRVEE